MSQNFVETLFQIAHHTSSRVKPRSKAKVFLHMRAEMGELDEEINIAMGELYKEPGVDGIIGEAADTLNCLADLLWVCADPLSNMAAYREALQTLVRMEAFDSVEGWGSLEIARDNYIDATSNLTSLSKLLVDMPIQNSPVMPDAARIVRSILFLVKAANPSITEADFLAIMDAKCAKWLSKAG